MIERWIKLREDISRANILGEDISRDVTLEYSNYDGLGEDISEDGISEYEMYRTYSRR